MRQSVRFWSPALLRPSWVGSLPVFVCIAWVHGSLSLLRDSGLRLYTPENDVHESVSSSSHYYNA